MEARQQTHTNDVVSSLEAGQLINILWDIFIQFMPPTLAPNNHIYQSNMARTIDPNQETYLDAS